MLRPIAHGKIVRVGDAKVPRVDVCVDWKVQIVAMRTLNMCSICFRESPASAIMGRAPESPYVILRHPAFTDNPGEAVGMTSETVRQVVESGGGSEPGSVDLLWPGAPTRVTALDGYRDPVAETHGDYAGSWSAGFAPVGNTGFVVIVQSREEEALKPELALARQMATWTVISAIPGVLFVVFAGVYNGWLRRRRSRRRSQAAP